MRLYSEKTPFKALQTKYFFRRNEAKQPTTVLYVFRTALNVLYTIFRNLKVIILAHKQSQTEMIYIHLPTTCNLRVNAFSRLGAIGSK